MRLQAISPEYSAFVSASAGSGKTKILIDRLLKLLLCDIKPNKILCLAFTKAAAAEILSRINQKLSYFTMCTPQELEQELAELGFENIDETLQLKARSLFVTLLEETEPLNIQTIHAFCQQLLLKFPYEAKVNLNFSLLNENKVSSLINKAKNILLEFIDNYALAKDALRYISWHIKEYSLNELIAEIITNRGKIERLFEHKKITEVEDVEYKEVFLAFLQNIPINHNDLAILSKAAATDAKRAEKLRKFLNYPQDLQLMLIKEYLYSFLTLEDVPTKLIATKKIREEFPDLHLKLEAEQQRVYLFNIKRKEIKTKCLTRCFLILSYHIIQIYTELKQQNNALDYDDLIKLAGDLLNNSEHAEWVRYKLDGGIDHVLIDEAQDTSLNQWQIINKICEEFFLSNEVLRSLFIVGDAKQSIFSFQGAMPELFNDQDLPEEVIRLSLSKSYRSGTKILEFVDRLFNQDHIRPLITGIEAEIKHIAHKQTASEVEIWPLIIEEELAEDKPWSLPSDFAYTKNLTADERLSLKVVEYIKEGLDSGAIKNPGDVMILTRRRTGFVRAIISELKRNNIEVAGLDRLKLSEHPAILDLIALTNFLLFPLDDLNLAIILKSPICNMDEEQLMHLCYKREGDLWSAFGVDSKDKQYLEGLIELAKHKDLFEFFFILIEEIRPRFIQEFGFEVNEVLDVFLDLVSEFKRENIASLQLFLDFIANNKTEIKRDSLNNQTQVRVMTVHAAKGLQAPIVILADTTKLPSNLANIIWLNDNELVWAGREEYYSEEVMNAKIYKMAQEYAEYLRLFYVAVTRAEDKLIIVGSSKNKIISERSWYVLAKNIL